MAFSFELAIMRFMRNFITLLFIIAIAMPSMACAMNARAHGFSQSSSCHSTSAYSREHKNSPTVMLLIDCMGVDMQKAGTSGIDIPDLKKDFVVYDLTSGADVVQVLHVHEGVIRGPPPNWPDFHETQPSLILTTQRFRI